MHGCDLDGLICILGCAIAQPSVCHLFSWDGFQGVLGLCSVFWGDDVWGTDSGVMRYGVMMS